MKKEPQTVEEMLKLTHVPVVAIDQESIFTYVNQAFVDEYGWTSKYLIGKPVAVIMPKHMRSAHNVGFSRYLATERSELLGKQLPLPIVYKDGSIATANHYILSTKQDDGRWAFAAIIDYPGPDAEG